MAARLQAPVLLLAERNRASMNNGGVNSGAGNRRIEYRSESVWDLNRKDGHKENAAGGVEVELTLDKNRNGSPGRKIDLVFTGSLQRYQEAKGGTRGS
jgi:hypothetical protein